MFLLSASMLNILWAKNDDKDVLYDSLICVENLLTILQEVLLCCRYVRDILLITNIV